MSSLQQNWRKGQNSFFLEAREEGGRGRGGRGRGEKWLNNVYTYEYMNKEKFLKNKNKNNLFS
jgi:hypothetical protein